MNMRVFGRKLRQTFGISAPRMAVRTHLSWRWKHPGAARADRADRGHVVVGLRLRPDPERFQSQRGRRDSRSKLEKPSSRRCAGRERQAARDGRRSSRAISTSRAARRRRFRSSRWICRTRTPRSRKSSPSCRSCFSDTGKQGTISIQTLSPPNASATTAYHYSLLVVRGGNPTDEFAGQLTLQAGLDRRRTCRRRSRCPTTSPTPRPR